VCRNLLRDGRLFPLLLRLERDLVEETRIAGCPECGGPLHRGYYLRKPRGWLLMPDEAYRLRRSLCCGREGCRSRAMPPSVLFLDRRVFYGAVVVLASALAQGATPARVRKLCRWFEVDRRTLARWRGWWRDSFPKTGAWRLIGGRLMPAVSPSALPRGLLDRFEGRLAQRLRSLLESLARSSASTLPEGASDLRRERPWEVG